MDSWNPAQVESWSFEPPILSVSTAYQLMPGGSGHLFFCTWIWQIHLLSWRPESSCGGGVPHHPFLRGGSQPFKLKIHNGFDIIIMWQIHSITNREIHTAFYECSNEFNRTFTASGACWFVTLYVCAQNLGDSSANAYNLEMRSENTKLISDTRLKFHV